MTVSTAPTRAHFWIGAFLIVLSAFCFASKGVLIKLAYQYPIDSISLLTLRMLFALPFYVGIALNAARLGLARSRRGTRTGVAAELARTPPPVALTGRQWVVLALLGITGYYLASFFDFLGLVYITASLERILLFTYPTFVLLLSAVGFGRHVTRLQMLALALTYAGILIAFADNVETAQQKNIGLGTFWVVLSGLVYAVYLVGSDRMIARVGSQRFTCYAMIAATVPTVLHCAVQNGLSLASFPMPVYALGLGMGLFATVVPTFMMAEGIRRIGSANASIIGSVGPIFTIILATAVLNESISIAQIGGTGLVLSGVFLIGWRGRKAEPISVAD